MNNTKVVVKKLDEKIGIYYNIYSKELSNINKSFIIEYDVIPRNCDLYIYCKGDDVDMINENKLFAVQNNKLFGMCKLNGNYDSYNIGIIIKNCVVGSSVDIYRFNILSTSDKSLIKGNVCTNNTKLYSSATFSVNKIEPFGIKQICSVERYTFMSKYFRSYNITNKNLPVLIIGVYENINVLEQHDGLIVLVWIEEDCSKISELLEYIENKKKTIVNFSTSDKSYKMLKKFKINSDMFDLEKFQQVKKVAEKSNVIHFDTPIKKIQNNETLVEQTNEKQTNEKQTNEKQLNIKSNEFVNCIYTDNLKHYVIEPLKQRFPEFTITSDNSMINNKCLISILFNGTDKHIDKMVKHNIKIVSNGIPKDDNVKYYKWSTIDDIITHITNANIDNFTLEISKFKNILFIATDYPGYGGSSTNSYNLINHFSKLGHKTYGLFLSEGDHIETNNKSYENISIVSTTTCIKHPNSDVNFKNIKILRKLDHILPKDIILNYFDNKIDLVVLRNYCDVDILKKYFNCPYYFLVPGLFGSKLDKKLEDIGSKTSMYMHVQQDILSTITKSTKIFVNGWVTQNILLKYYNINTNILYFNEILPTAFDTNNESESKKILYGNNRKYLLGVVISDFTRKIKNVKDIITIFEMYPLENKIAIGKNSNCLSYIPNTTCIDNIDNNEVRHYMSDIKILLNTSFYEGYSNVLVEGLHSGCKVLKYKYYKKQFDYDVEDINDMINNINIIKDAKPAVFGIWETGKLTYVEKLCVNSYIKNGFNFTLYTYENIDDNDIIFSQMSIINANTIMEYSAYKKNKNLLKFMILYNGGGIYTDMSMVWMTNKNIVAPYLFVKNKNDDNVDERFIKSPAKSNIIKDYIDILSSSNQKKKSLKDLIKQYELLSFLDEYKNFFAYDNVNISNSINNVELSESICGIYIDKKITDINKFEFGSKYLHLLSKYYFKLSVFCCATNPLESGYPIYESVASFINVADEIIVIYGRDENESEEELLKMSNKIKLIKTNSWPVDWSYNVMTEHFNIGLNSCTGDIAFKFDIDFICRCDDLGNHDEFREKIFSNIEKFHVIQIPRINYLIGGYFSYCKNIGPYAINKYLLEKDKKKYYIGVKGYCNTICIEDTYNEAIIEEDKFAIMNYDCTFMNLDQYIDKQYRWFMAYFKQFKTLSKFNIDIDTVEDKNKLLTFCQDRMKIKRTNIYINKGYDENPSIIRERIKNLTDDKFGKSCFLSNTSSLLKIYKDTADKYAKGLK